ncbi:MAG: hypothetical protein EDR02_15230 [Actinobacteria bacterium]|nr:MAG: hypothetical protein EDR02_15230 [Actinomycetota bacterium]RIK04314.1 MAG: hypothetical protein DCC48_13820 [Acidobacteriota bacterium]
MKVRRSTLRLVAALVALSSVASACSDDGGDDDGEDEGATTTASVPELTGDPVKLMVIAEIEAGVANPEIPEGAEAAAQALNRDGGFNGGPYEIIVCDTQNDPNTAAECGRQAVEEGVVAVVGALTPHAGEYMPLLEENSIPAVGLVPASAADFTSPMAFPISGGLPTASAGLAASLAENGSETISLARIDLLAAAAIAGFADMGLERYDQTVANDVAIPEGAPDMSTYVAAAEEGGTDGILVGLSGQDATNFVIAARQSSPDMAISMTTTDIGGAIEALGDTAEGIITNNTYLPPTSDTAAIEKYREDMDAVGYGDDLTGFRLNSYVSVMVVADLITKINAADPVELVAELNATDGLETGYLPPIQFVEGGVGGIPRVFNPCGMSMEVKDGSPTPITGKFINAFTGDECEQPTD